MLEMSRVVCFLCHDKIDSRIAEGTRAARIWREIDRRNRSHDRNFSGECKVSSVSRQKKIVLASGSSEVRPDVRI